MGLPETVDCWGLGGPGGPKNHSKRLGAKPPTFPDGFPRGRKPLRPRKSINLGFYLSAPFGAAPFYGYPMVGFGFLHGAKRRPNPSGKMRGASPPPPFEQVWKPTEPARHNKNDDFRIRPGFRLQMPRTLGNPNFVLI